MYFVVDHIGQLLMISAMAVATSVARPGTLWLTAHRDLSQLSPLSLHQPFLLHGRVLHQVRLPMDDPRLLINLGGRVRILEGECMP